MRMKSITFGALAAGALLAAPAARAEGTVRVVSFGGAFEAAMTKAWIEPFSAAEKVKFEKEQYDGGLAKLRAMVESKNVAWDLMDMETNDVITGCDEGLLEKLDPKLLGDVNDFVEGSVLPCGVASMVWSTVYAYDTEKMKTAPTTMADFFDVAKFPGKRGLRKSPKGTLEWALIADGVPADKVYETLGTDAGLEQAFKKLGTIKKDIVWWEAGSQPPQLLADGAVSMTMAYNGRIFDAQQKDKRPFKIVWDGQVYDYEWWAVPAGAKNKADADKFIAYASAADNIGKLSQFIAYAPPRKSAVGKIAPETLPHMPTAPENFKNALQIDATFWADNFDSVNNRFMTWLSQ